MTYKPTIIDRIRWKLRSIAWPGYECEQCVGQDPWQGCYCAYYDCVAPNTPPEWWRVQFRKLLTALGLGWYDYKNLKEEEL